MKCAQVLLYEAVWQNSAMRAELLQFLEGFLVPENCDSIDEKNISIHLTINPNLGLQRFATVAVPLLFEAQFLFLNKHLKKLVQVGIWRILATWQVPTH